MNETAEKPKISKGVSIIDEGFIRNRSANFHLSVQVGNDGLTYCVFDIRNNRYIAFETYSFNGIHHHDQRLNAIHEIVLQNDTMNNLFKSVQVGIISERSTLIPNAVFEKGKEGSYLGFNLPEKKNETALVYDMKSIPAKNIFSVPNDLITTFKKYFPNVKFNHHSSPLIENLMTTYKNQTGKRIFVHVQLSHFEIIILDGKELIYYNSFRHQSSEDFIYYLLFVMEQVELNPETAELTLLGEVERNSALYSIVYNYVRNIKFGTRNDMFGYGRGFTDILPHFYFGILNQYLCV